MKFLMITAAVWPAKEEVPQLLIHPPPVHANAGFSMWLDSALLFWTFIRFMELWEETRRRNQSSNVSDHAPVVKTSFGVCLSPSFSCPTKTAGGEKEEISSPAQQISTYAVQLSQLPSLCSSSIIAAVQVVLNVTRVSKANGRPR